MLFTDGIYTSPKRCNKPDCDSTSFRPDKSQSRQEIYQKIQVQNIRGDSKEGGRLCDTITCELRGSLINSLTCGDTVVVNGILKTILDKHEGNKSKHQSVYKFYIDVNSVVDEKKKMFSASEEEDETENFTKEELDEIRDLAEDEEILSRLIKSFCPTIYGNELLKLGLLLSLVGGSSAESNAHSLRSNIHMLIFGEPGLGKSQLLKFVNLVSPKSFYVSGSGTTEVGLTVSLKQDPTTGQTSMDPGALILSHEGTCCIDEFAKMSARIQQSLLEAMEQQTISVAKSGILCTLSTKTTIIAAANPNQGNFG
jgi:DNA helicase MCM8